MAQTYHDPQPTLATRFDHLLDDLENGRTCSIGGFTIAKSHPHPSHESHFVGEFSLAGTQAATRGEFTVCSSLYENLLGGKVDLAIIINHSEIHRSDVTFSTHDELH
jgi:hypothetical protein